MNNSIGPPLDPPDAPIEKFECESCHSVFSDADMDITEYDYCPECEANGEKGYLELLEL
jgi:rubredoxin